MFFHTFLYLSAGVGSSRPKSLLTMCFVEGRKSTTFSFSVFEITFGSSAKLVGKKHQKAGS